jgi:SAM-dependent methyltransferase
VIRVSNQIQEQVISTYGRTYEALSGLPASKIGLDVLDEEKVHDQIALLCQTFRIEKDDLRGKRILEIGSGYGVFLAVARRDYGLESFGVEPSSSGFASSLAVSREILAEYGIDGSIVSDAQGESLPFTDSAFDFVFSSNVLEHTEDPPLVLSEAIRVLKPGGRMQIIFPNYGSFFEGHYALPWCPYLNKPLGKMWVRLWGKQPDYIDTLQLVNFFSARRWMRENADAKIVGFGESIFRERMLGLKIKPWAGLGRVKTWLARADRAHLVRPITWLLLCAKSFDPIVLSAVRRAPQERPPPPDNRHIYEVRWTDWTDMKVFGPTSRWLRSLVGDLLQRIQGQLKGGQVLDFGCGEGTTTDYLALVLPDARVIGLDRSRAGVRCAAGRYSRANLEFLCRESTAPFPSDSFLLVTCLEVLEHVEDWRAATRELTRLSSRYLIVSFPIGRMRPFERNVGHLRNFLPRQFERYAKSVGLRPIAVFYAGYPFYSPIFRNLCNTFNSGGNSLTIGRYSWFQRKFSDLIYFLFRHLSSRHCGDQFCGLFEKNLPAGASTDSP